MKKLRKLLDLDVDDNFGEEVVLDICDNSQRVAPGSMFIALNRNAENRKNHVVEAVARGAKYILQQGEKECFEERNGVLFFFVKNVRVQLACIASKFFESSFDNTVAITGTNGKSSTVDILRQIWIGSDADAASIGTLGVITKENQQKLPNNMTSPDCLELHRILHELCSKGVKNVAMEATSQGIEQHRVDAIKFDICAFTNFTQDHLDYHKTFENYWNAKARLFSELASKRSVFVINSDDPYSRKIHDIASDRGIKCLSYGYNANDAKILEVEKNESDQRIKISFFGKEFSFILPLHGAFQVHNSLCAFVISNLTGTDVGKILDEIQKLQPISGRLELVAKFKSSHMYIDYAHTPDALQNAILALKNHAKNRIITVFGCGGNRDQQKRALMGKVAENLSDVVIVTDDNPREEDPGQIRKMILEGCGRAIEIVDRKEAIEFAMSMLSAGDILLVAGKGHETYQQIEKNILEFSDKKIILDKLKAEK